MSQKRIQAYFYLLLVSLIWGAAGPVIKFTLSDLPPLIFLSYRFAVSTALALLLTFWVERRHYTKQHLSPNHIGQMIVYGFLTSTVSLGLLFLGYSQTTAIAGTVLGAVQPILIVAAGAVFLHETVTIQERLGMIIALIGTGISIIAPLTDFAPHNLSGELTGNLIILLSVLLGVFLSIWSKVLLNKELSPLFMTNLSFVIGFATLTPFAVWHHGASTVWHILASAPLTAHLGVWYMGVLSGTVAYTLWHRGLKRIEAGEAALFSYLLPIWAAPLAFFWLGEHVSYGFVIGAILIAAGVFLAEYKRRQITKQRKSSQRKYKIRRKR